LEANAVKKSCKLERSGKALWRCEQSSEVGAGFGQEEGKQGGITEVMSRLAMCLALTLHFFSSLPVLELMFPTVSIS